MEHETLEALVAQRRGYKFVDNKGKSPYQGYTYDLKSREVLTTDLNRDEGQACGSGWNLATLKWIADNCLKLDGKILECEIPDDATIIVPRNSDGKFRTDKIRILAVHKLANRYPLLKNLFARFKKYKPVNPIVAEEMPPASEIKEIMNQVRNQVGDQVWNQVGNQVRDQVGNQVGDQVWDQVGDQVWDQVRVCAYHAVKEFFNLDYDHPAFQLIKLGIIVVHVCGKFKVFGKGGKFLGEFEDKEN